MSRKHFAAFALIGTLAITVAAFVAYRAGARQGADPGRLAPPKSAESCVDFSAAATHSGEDSCVRGRILKVYDSRSGNVFFDFCDNYRDCPFSSLVFSSDRRKFRDLTALTGRIVEIHGRVSLYHGKPEIVVHDPDQIKAAD